MAGTGLVAGEAVVDALPYFDQGYEAPGVREAVSLGVYAGGSRSLALGTGNSSVQFAAPTLAPILVLRLRHWWRRRRADTDLLRTT